MTLRKCPICGKNDVEIIDGSRNFLDEDEVKAIQKDHPTWSEEINICEECIDYDKMHPSEGATHGPLREEASACGTSF